MEKMMSYALIFSINALWGLAQLPVEKAVEHFGKKPNIQKKINPHNYNGICIHKVIFDKIRFPQLNNI